MDVDNDGERDSVGDAIKKGTKGLIDNVSSWFNYVLGDGENE